MFEFWNNLPEELKLECIKWMDLKTRFKLRSASHTERNLVSNSQRLYIYKIIFRNEKDPDGFRVYIMHEWQRMVGKFAQFKGEEQLTLGAIPFLSFVFQNCIVSKVFFSFPNAHVNYPLARLESEKPYHIEEIEGGVPVPLSFLQNCVPNSIQYVRLCYPRVYKQPFPVEELLTPALQTTRKWRIELKDCPDFGVAIAKKWMEWDVDCKSRLEVYYDDYKKVVPSFLKRFGTVKIVQQTPTMVRFETPNPKKHMILQMTCEFILVMVAADLEEKDFKKYVFSPF